MAAYGGGDHRTAERFPDKNRNLAGPVQAAPNPSGRA